MKQPSIITIDGPAASGKSTLGQLLARRLGYVYFDTGVMYRAVTALALLQQIDLDDEAAVSDLAARSQIEVLSPTLDDGRQYTVLADGQDLTWRLRSPEVERHVSKISCYPPVRKILRDQQRRIGGKGEIVMVGRDIGAVVMPEADLKIFLHASAEERARRRTQEAITRGSTLNYDEVLSELCRRDELDRQNTYIPETARILESDNTTPGELVEQILAWFEHTPTRQLER